MQIVVRLPGHTSNHCGAALVWMGGIADGTLTVGQLELHLAVALREQGGGNDGGGLTLGRVVEHPDLLLELLDLVVNVDNGEPRLAFPRDEGIHERVERGRLVLGERASCVVEEGELGLEDLTLRLEHLPLRYELLDGGGVLGVVLVWRVCERCVARDVEDAYVSP